MSDFNVIKCPACGSSVVEMQGENIAKCSHCGSLLQSNYVAPKRASNKKPLVFIALFALVIVAGLVWILAKKEPSLKPETHNESVKIDTSKINIAPINLPTVDTSKLAVSNDDIKKYQENQEKPQIDIIHTATGETVIGGLYWIFTIQNNSPITVARPGIIMSLFDQQNNRIDEIRAWSKHGFLPQGQKTEVLVSLAKPPKDKFHFELQGMAKVPNNFDFPQEIITVKSFRINGVGKSVEIVGDVYNPHKYQVDFIEVLAIAKDNQGNSIGMASAFASTSNLPADNSSGFKIRAGTFVAQVPDSWQLWAFGRKHRK